MGQHLKIRHVSLNINDNIYFLILMEQQWPYQDETNAGRLQNMHVI